ncbi:MAG: ribonuclease Y, partial [Verrucomicrobia bacterium]|nr:ribonuclease Y [Verrucomicrobiota bacterium]
YHFLQKSRFSRSENAVEEAKRVAETILREAKVSASEQAIKYRKEVEESFAHERKELEQLESRLNERDILLNRQLEQLVQRENHLHEEQNDLRKKEAALESSWCEINNQKEVQKRKLEEISHLSQTEAREMLIKQIEECALKDASDISRHIIEDARISAEEEARKVISMAIQRYASEHSFETTTSTLALPGDEIKGRIIGREGRNIRSFESATGVTVLIDDTPNAVVLSSFDPVRREVARESMNRLIQDGRIHPTRIEEVVAKVSQEIDEAVVRAGEAAALKTGVGPLHVDVIRLLGKLRFRHSFSQNLLDHSVEVSHLAGLLAGELGVDVGQAKRAGLLHDIGKALNHEVEGAHAIVGADFLRRHGESPAIIDGVASHHEEVPYNGILGILVSSADAISASRPGARSESMTTYIQRLEELEKIGKSFDGVEKCFALQAGREMRVIVKPEIVDDDAAYHLARSVARKVEEVLQYPGQIRVTVIRETRCVEFAK